MMQKIFIKTIVIGLIFAFIGCDIDNKEATQEVTKTTKVTASTNFSIAGIDWKDTPEQVSKKVKESGFLLVDIDKNPREEDLEYHTGNFIFYPYDGNNDYALYLLKKFPFLNNHKDILDTNFFMLWDYADRTNNSETKQLNVYFSQKTKKLVLYEFTTYEDNNQLYEALVEKYGSPSKTIVKHPSYGVYKWEGNKHFLVYNKQNHHITIVNTANLEESLAISQKIIDEFKHAEKNKMKKLF